MRNAIAALLCASGLAAAADDKDVAKELEKFQGTWIFERVEGGGQEVPIVNFKGMTVTFEGDTYIVKEGVELVQKAIQKLDPSKSPKTFDVKVTQGTNRGMVILGIYEISGDTLKVCFDPEGKKRPTEFKTQAGSQIGLVVHKRVKK